jgi:hypothetical protein
MRVGFDPYDESPIKRRGEEYLEHEFHDGQQGYDEPSPVDSKAYDYEGYPHGNSSRSRSSTPMQSPAFMNSSPMPGNRSTSLADVPLPSREGRASLAIPSSASPLLRRATTQPGQYSGMKQPSFRGPPTAPPTSSLPRVNQTMAGVQAARGSQAPDTPPSSTGKGV